jgi:transcriptional regulator with XRE-family HTH domain
MTIGERIKARREELNIGQTELAKRTKISKQLLYKYETNIITNIPSDKIENIAKALFTTPAYLMGWKDAIVNYVDSTYEVDDRLMKIAKAYSKASPEIQKAVELLLKADQSDS